MVFETLQILETNGVPGELMSWLLNGTGRLVLMLPLIVKVEVVLWSLDEVLEEPEIGSVVDPED